MTKVLILIGVMYLGAAIYIADWLILVSFFIFVGLMYIAKFALRIESFEDFKKQCLQYWGELFTAILGSLILPYLIFLKSESDTELAVLFGIIAVPSVFLICYLWLRGVNRLFLAIKTTLLNLKK
jgi:hypothetical protein